MNWLKKLFAPPVPARKDNIQVFRLDDDDSFASNKDVLCGLQFSATLHLSTPLSVLTHHGEIFAGPPSQAPQYGNRAEGIWVPKTKTWRELGIDIDESPESSVASDIGPVLPSEYLPFLIQFRRIIESEWPADAKLSQLESMANASPLFEDLWARVSSVYSGFPRTFV